MDKKKLSNLLLIMAAVLVVTLCAFSVRLRASPGTNAEAREARGCCCCIPGENAQKTTKE